MKAVTDTLKDFECQTVISNEWNREKVINKKSLIKYRSRKVARNGKTEGASSREN